MKRHGWRTWLWSVPLLSILLLFGCVQHDSSENQGNAQAAAHQQKIVPLKPEPCPQAYRFVAFGDWGAGTPFQKDIAAQLQAQYEKQPFDSALLLGDNIYPIGDVKKFGKAYFTDMYSGLIKSGVHFIVALGNHDIAGGFQEDQIKFFRMPAYYYKVPKPHVDFFVLDTNTFGKNQVQQQWLDKALAGSKAEWKIVMGHHPIYSSGEHGVSRSLQKTLEPILKKYKVDLYLAGHDHDYERFKPINGIQHVVSGGAGAYLRGFPSVLPQSLVRIKAHHYLSFYACADELNMTVIDKTGKTIDQAQWQKEAKKPQKKISLPGA